MQLRRDDGQRMLRIESGAEGLADRACVAADAVACRNRALDSATRTNPQAPGR